MAEITSRFCESIGFEDLRLSQYGRLNAGTEEAILPFLTENIIVFYTAKGSNTIKLGNAMVNLEPGMITAVFPGQCVNCAVKGLKDDTEAYWAELCGETAERVMLRAGLTPAKPTLVLNGTETARIFAELTDPNQEYSGLRAAGLMLELIDSLLTETPRPSQPKVANLPQYYVEKSIRFIETKYPQDISVEDVAEYCGLNRSYLGKLFRDATGMTTQEYLIRHRMKIACSYLEVAAAPIATIARSVGYPNQLHFSRAFHKVFDIPPREWQKRNRKTER